MHPRALLHGLLALPGLTVLIMYAGSGDERAPGPSGMVYSAPVYDLGGEARSTEPHLVRVAAAPVVQDSALTYRSEHVDSVKTWYTTTRVDTMRIPVPPSGLPFGAFDLWNTSYSSPAWGPGPFNLSANADAPEGVVLRIAAARALGHKLLLSMTSGKHDRYLTDGKFDYAKWKARQDRYNTRAIQEAIGRGVADGTVLGAIVMDEPNHREGPKLVADWGGVMTKALVDSMAAYVKAMFPTLPAGVSIRADWRPAERYQVVDFIITQYVAAFGPIAAWRDTALALARRDGVAIAFSLNIINGGAGFTEPSCPVLTTGGVGENGSTPGTWRCRVSPTQLRAYGMALVTQGCAFLVWRYDPEFMESSENQQAFKDIAAVAALRSAPACRRSSPVPQAASRTAKAQATRP
jgi:hypothetical protein